MYTRRQRQLAGLVLLVLALGVAMLCGACVHLTNHPCCGPRACAICAFLRTGLRPSALRVEAPTLVAVALLVIARSVTSPFISRASLCTLGVRMND